MIFTETPLPGAFILELRPHSDDRGFFARAFCADAFRQQGLNPSLAQVNVSFNKRRGTLRGMHFQKPPHAETKIVRCVRGRIFDAIVDIRPESSSYMSWFGVELDAMNHRSLYVPEGFAHGFLTLTDDVEILYLMGSAFVPSAAAGFRYDDPTVAIGWPELPSIVSERDLSFPLLVP